MNFTEEERRYIDAELKLADEIQAKNGNKLCPFDEFAKKFLKELKKEEEAYRV